MPDRDVHTIQDAIFFQYAKLIARSAFGIADGTQAKKQCYGFVKKTFYALQSGEKSWSDIGREDWCRNYRDMYLIPTPFYLC